MSDIEQDPSEEVIKEGLADGTEIPEGDEPITQEPEPVDG